MTDKILKNNKTKKLILAVAAIFIVLISVTAIGVKAVQYKNAQIVMGTWLYADGTEYVFDGKSKGCMKLKDADFEYKYIVTNEKLKINFKDKKVRDAVYSYEIENEKLTIKGEKGTVGGTYVLMKK